MPSTPTPPDHSRAAPLQTELLVIGGGPGGYTAAFRAADLGKQVTLVERHATLGGVCLNVGCIPSKTLLHAAALLDESREMASMGICFETPTIDLGQLRSSKEQVVTRLATGLRQLAAQRKVTVIQGEARFEGPNRARIDGERGATQITFEQCIVASGSRPTEIPAFPNGDPRLLDSTDALALRSIPTSLLIIGGGIIGLEMATVYAALGSQIDIVELQPGLIPGCDRDLVRPLERRIKQRYRRIMTDTRVSEIQPERRGLRVTFEGKHEPQCYDQVLVAVGRTPNGDSVNAGAAGVEVDPQGFIPVDHLMRTRVPHIFAIGDVVGQPMLAHKATHEAKIAAEVIAGGRTTADPALIPAVAYTDPEVAWVGLTETRAKADGTPYEKAAFPWSASGRALGIGRNEGVTKLLFDPQSHRVLGAGIVGPNAGELIGEAALALQLGATLADISGTIHPHPTLNETIGMAAELGEGTITDLPPPRKRRKR